MNKEMSLEKAIQEALPKSPDAEFETDYHRFICEILKTPIRHRLELVQDILGDVSDEPQAIRSLSLLLTTYINTIDVVEKRCKKTQRQEKSNY